MYTGKTHIIATAKDCFEPV